MHSLTLPFSSSDIDRAIAAYVSTPFFLYDEQRIRDSSSALYSAFHNNGFGNFQNHFAVKANPNRHILRILQQTGMGMDCSSLSELHSSEALGIRGEDIMFTSNNTTLNEFDEAKRLGAIINLDDISHIETLEMLGFPELVSCRWNPGDLVAGNGLIGNPKDIKYGMETSKIIESYRQLKQKGVKRFGLHTMVVTDERRVESLIETARLLFSLAHQIYEQTGVTFDFINLGGGISIPYKFEQNDVDVGQFAAGVRKYYDEIILGNKLGNPQIRMENGRYLLGNAGVYITRAINIAEKHGNIFVGLDGGMQDFPRPGRVKAYHHATVIGKNDMPHTVRQILTGSLCIGTDIFTPALGNEPQGRLLPEIKRGDLLAIHTAGAHGHATGYNYNGRLRCGEVLKLVEEGAMRIIRSGQIEEQLHWGVPPLQ